MSRMLAILMGGCLVVGSVSGCGPRLTDEELGEVQTKAQDLPGAGEGYLLPAQKASQDEEHDHSHDHHEDL